MLIPYRLKRSRIKSPLFVTVNAVYMPLENQMIFPVGILQEPIFDVSLPAAINFGALGSLMGHELAHGFDDTGRMINHAGKLRDWWNIATVQRFQDRTACLVKQYSSYNFSGKPISGKKTLSMTILKYIAFIFTLKCCNIKQFVT